MPIELREEGSSPCTTSRMKRGGLIAIGTAAVIIFGGLIWPWWSEPVELPSCAQPPVLAPPPDVYANATQFSTTKYRNLSIDLLSGAIQIPTESFDDLPMDPTKDKRFEVFGEFHAYLANKFPRTSEFVETVNTYGLLYTLPGTDRSLKPAILMAHQDVVPVNPSTVYQWDHPPFSGYYDGEYIWGRGSSDTKSSLIAILEATENLLKQGWKPTRDVLISFGFDEEVSGPRGAKSIAEEITARYGPDSIELIVDEGTGLTYESGALFALPTVAEKGYVDVLLTVETPGGHSSMPPDHSGIGFAAQVVTELEDAESFRPSLAQDHPLVAQLSCFAAYSPDLDLKTRERWSLLSSSAKARQALAEDFEHDRYKRPAVVTTQAVDIVKGGVKVNALPEVVEVTTNYRINLDSSVADVLDRYVEIAASVARRNDLGLVRNNETLLAPTENGVLRVATSEQTLEPVSSSPTSGLVWDRIGGITRHVYEDVLGMGPLYFAPTLIGGNTDTKHYLNLTHNIYRYTPMLQTGGNAHTVNEHSSVDGHIAGVMWYYEFLQVL